MANYTIRIELHGATRQDYLDLHAAMSRIGAKTYVMADDGRTYSLPSAEYSLDGSILSIEEARAVAFSVATRIRPNPWVLVSEVISRAWSLPEHFPAPVNALSGLGFFGVDPRSALGRYLGLSQ